MAKRRPKQTQFNRLFYRISPGGWPIPVQIIEKSAGPVRVLSLHHFFARISWR
jgi:hypothetical protein